MTSKREIIYSCLPIPLQNAAVSLQGWLYARRRYGARFQNYVHQLMKSQWLSGEQFYQLQCRELRNLLSECVQQVPYYREILSAFTNRIDSFALENLKELPLLEKSQLRENPEVFFNKDRYRFGHEEGHTSGTSGIPLVWLYDGDSIQFDLAFRERQYRWAGTFGAARSGRFSGRVLLGKHQRPPYWRHNAAYNQWLFSTYHMNDDTFPLYYQALKKLDLVYLDGYPSALYTLAQWINQQNLSGNWQPWAVITTAETLMEFQRQEIEKAFRCKVFNFYSSSEGAPFITQCDAGNLHLNPESGIIEFLRPDGTDAEPEEDAEIAITSFFQKSMPLIRYRIGDTAALAENQSCPCGRHMPIVKHIGGRESDTLYTTERGRIGSAGLSTVFYKIPSRLSQSQFVQTDTDTFVFRYVPLEDPLTEAEKAVIIEQFKNRLGASVNIDIEIVDKIPQGPSGKTRLIIGLDKSKKTAIISNSS